MALSIRRTDMIVWVLVVLEFVATVAVLGITGTEAHVFSSNLKYPRPPSKLVWNVTAVSRPTSRFILCLTVVGHHYTSLLLVLDPNSLSAATVVETLEQEPFSMVPRPPSRRVLRGVDHCCWNILLEL